MVGGSNAEVAHMALSLERLEFSLSVAELGSRPEAHPSFLLCTKQLSHSRKLDCSIRVPVRTLAKS